MLPMKLKLFYYPKHKQEEMFNFAAAVDGDTSTFQVSLDVAPDAEHDF